MGNMPNFLGLPVCPYREREPQKHIPDLTPISEIREKHENPVFYDF